MPWVRFVNNQVWEVWDTEPILHPDMKAQVQEKTLDELAALGWTPPPPPPPAPPPPDKVVPNLPQRPMTTDEIRDSINTILAKLRELNVIE